MGGAGVFSGGGCGGVLVTAIVAFVFGGVPFPTSARSSAALAVGGGTVVVLRGRFQFVRRDVEDVDTAAGGDRSGRIRGGTAGAVCVWLRGDGGGDNYLGGDLLYQLFVHHKFPADGVVAGVAAGASGGETDVGVGD